jgi:hypothetical protein
MIINTGNLINQIESSWSGANAADLSNISINRPSDLWSYERLASADTLRIIFKVSNSVAGPFTYWIFDGMVLPANLSNSKQALTTKQDMFLLNTIDGLKEILKIKWRSQGTILKFGIL